MVCSKSIVSLVTRRTTTHTSKLRNAAIKNGPPNAPTSIRKPRAPSASAYPPVISPNTIEAPRNMGVQRPKAIDTARASRPEYVFRKLRRIQTDAAKLGRSTTSIKLATIAGVFFMSGSKPSVVSANTRPMLPTVRKRVAFTTAEESRITSRIFAYCYITP